MFMSVRGTFTWYQGVLWRPDSHLWFFPFLFSFLFSGNSHPFKVGSEKQTTE